MNTRWLFPHQTSYIIEYEDDANLILTDTGLASDEAIFLCADYVVAELVVTQRYKPHKRLFFWDRMNGLYQIEHDQGELEGVVHCSTEQAAFIQHLVLTFGATYAD